MSNAPAAPSATHRSKSEDMRIKHAVLEFLRYHGMKNTMECFEVESQQKLKETTDYYKLDLKAVFISSKYETEEECREVGGLDFIRCPFESDKVVETMLKWSRVGNTLN